MVFHWNLIDRKSDQISRTLLGILAYLNNALIWMVSILPPISDPFSPLSKPSRTIPSTPITIGITVLLMFYSFLSSLARSKYLAHFSFS